MTVEAIWKAVKPNVQSLVYGIVAALFAGGAATYLQPPKPAVATPAAPQSCLAAAPAKSPQTDQTKLQLVGIQHTLDQIADVARQINTKECVQPKKATKASLVK